MTAAASAQVPLGYMLEAVWPDEARWLGLIGRTELTQHELAFVNCATWPELAKPFTLLSQTFDQSWEEEWGQASVGAARLWFRSPVLVEMTQRDEMLADTEVDTEASWTLTVTFLAERLSLLGQHLKPLAPGPEPTIGEASYPRRTRFPLQVPPRERRMREGFAHAA